MSQASKLARDVFFTSCIALDKFVPRRGVPVLLYHSVDNSGSTLSVSPENFAWQMGYLARHGWFTMTLDELEHLLKVGRMPKKRFIVTFDDGFRNNLTEALPILTAFGFTATVYVATEFIGRHNSFVTAKMSEFPMLTWDDVIKLRDAGWQIESHGHTHKNLPDMDISQVRWELQVSRDMLEKHADVRSKHFCYPRGKYTPEVVQAVKDADYRTAVSIHAGMVRPMADLWVLPRLAINDRVTFNHFRALFTEPYSWFASARRRLLGKY